MTKSAMGVEIPEMWLCGRTQARMLEGMKIVAARAMAIEDWNEQERLEQRFLAERAV